MQTSEYTEKLFFSDSFLINSGSIDLSNQICIICGILENFIGCLIRVHSSDARQPTVPIGFVAQGY